MRADLKSSPQVTVDLWEFDLTSIEPVLDILTPDELERARRFRFEQHRRAWTAGRCFLRQTLAGYLHCLPGELDFSYTEFGKPYLDKQPEMRFNLSHSQDKALLAITLADVNIGADVEHISPENATLDIAERFFAESEVKQLQAYVDEDWTKAFFRCWTRKEAFIKAVGEGLSIPLHTFTVRIDSEPAAFLVETADDTAWSVHSIQIDSDYEAALALDAHPENVKIEIRR